MAGCPPSNFVNMNIIRYLEKYSLDFYKFGYEKVNDQDYNAIKCAGKCSFWLSNTTHSSGSVVQYLIYFHKN